MSHLDQKWAALRRYEADEAEGNGIKPSPTFRLFDDAMMGELRQLAAEKSIEREAQKAEARKHHMDDELLTPTQIDHRRFAKAVENRMKEHGVVQRAALDATQAEKSRLATEKRKQAQRELALKQMDFRSGLSVPSAPRFAPPGGIPTRK